MHTFLKKKSIYFKSYLFKIRCIEYDVIEQHSVVTSSYFQKMIYWPDGLNFIYNSFFIVL